MRTNPCAATLIRPANNSSMARVLYQVKARTAIRITAEQAIMKA